MKHKITTIDYEPYYTMGDKKFTIRFRVDMNRTVVEKFTDLGAAQARLDYIRSLDYFKTGEKVLLNLYS